MVNARRGQKLPGYRAQRRGTDVAITQWILGIRPDYDGLRIAPVIPESWPGFKVTRVFRGITYGITVRRAGPGSSVALRVDGRPVSGNVIPLPAADCTGVQVEGGYRKPQPKKTTTEHTLAPGADRQVKCQGEYTEF